MNRIFQRIMLCVFFALFFTTLAYNRMNRLEPTYPEKISLKALPSDISESKGAEVWIQNIFVDGKPVELENILLKSGQRYDYGSLMLNGRDKSSSKLDLEFPANASVISVQFLKHDWSGKVILSYGKEQDVIDLYSEKPDTYIYLTKTVPIVKQVTNSSTIIFLLIFFVSLFIAVLMDVFLLNKHQKLRQIIIIFCAVGWTFALCDADISNPIYFLGMLFTCCFLCGFYNYICIPLFYKFNSIFPSFFLFSCILFSTCIAYIIISYSDFDYDLLLHSNQLRTYPVQMSVADEAIENEDIISNESWLNNIVLAGESVPLNKLSIISNNWTLREDNRYLGNTSAGFVVFPCTNLPVSLNLTFSPYSGLLRVRMNTYEKELPLYQEAVEWNYVSIKDLFFEDIVRDINNNIHRPIIFKILYMTLTSLILGSCFSIIPLELMIFLKHNQITNAIVLAILLLCSGYSIAKICTQSLFNEHELIIQNIGDNAPGFNEIQITELTSSGCLDNNMSYEIASFNKGDWEWDYSNAISLKSEEKTSSPLIYRFRTSNILGLSRESSLLSHIALSTIKSPQGGHLLITYNGKSQKIDCYSKEYQQQYIELESLFTPSVSTQDADFYKTFFAGICINFFCCFFLFFKRFYTEYLSIVKSENIKDKVLRVVIALYGSFALIAQSLFFSEEKIIDFSRKNILILGGISIVLYTLIPFAALLLKHYCDKIRTSELPALSELKKFKRKAFFLVLSLLLLWYLALYPGGLNLDIISQLDQAHGLASYTDWHPIFHTMLIKLFTLKRVTILPYFLFQFIFISYIWGEILGFCYENGLKKKYIIGMTIVFFLLPPTEIVTEATKDVLGTYSYIWLTLLLTKFIKYGAPKFWSKKTNLVQMIISMLFVMNIRHSQQVVVLAFIVIVLCISLKYETIRKKCISFFLLFLCINSVLVVGINRYTNCYNYTRGLKFVTPIGDMASLAMYNQELDSETIAVLESAMPLETWKREYTPYYPSQVLFNNGIDFGNIFGQYSLRDIMPLYIKNFVKYPLYVIRSRLLSSNLIWSITQGTAEKAYNQHTYLEVRPNPFGIERTNTLLKTFVKDYITSYHSSDLLDAVLWRAGIHIIFLLIVIYMLCHYKLYRNILILIPCILFTCCLMLTLPASNFRYVFYLPVTSVFALLVLPVINDIYGQKSKQIDNKSKVNNK